MRRQKKLLPELYIMNKILHTYFFSTLTVLLACLSFYLLPRTVKKEILGYQKENKDSAWKCSLDGFECTIILTRGEKCSTTIHTPQLGKLTFHGSEESDSEGKLVGFFGSIENIQKKAIGTFFIKIATSVGDEHVQNCLLGSITLLQGEGSMHTIALYPLQ